MARSPTYQSLEVMARNVNLAADVCLLCVQHADDSLSLFPLFWIGGHDLFREEHEPCRLDLSKIPRQANFRRLSEKSKLGAVN